MNTLNRADHAHECRPSAVCCFRRKAGTGCLTTVSAARTLGPYKGGWEKKNHSRHEGTSLLRLTACTCGAHGLVRVDRALWMRLFPTRRHYYCPACRASLFLSRDAVTRALVAPPQRPAPPRPLPPNIEPITRRMGESALDGDATLPARYF